MDQATSSFSPLTQTRLTFGYHPGPPSSLMQSAGSRVVIGSES